MKPLVRLNQNRNQLCPPKHEKLTKRSRDTTNAVSCFLAKDMIAMSTVEKEAVKKLIKVRACRHKLLGRKSFPQLYKERCGKLGSQLRDATTNLRSNRNSEPNMSLTSHYVDGEWALQSRSLQTTYFLELTS